MQMVMFFLIIMIIIAIRLGTIDITISLLIAGVVRRMLLVMVLMVYIGLIYARI